MLQRQAAKPTPSHQPAVGRKRQPAAAPVLERERWPELPDGVGNQAAVRLLQRRAAAAPPAAGGSADAEKSAASSLLSAAHILPRTSGAPLTLQRKCTACEAEDEMRVQPRLQVGPAGDRYEQEADNIAGHVMAMRGGDVSPAGAAVQPACSACSSSKDELQLRRMEAAVEEEDEHKGQARSLDAGGGGQTIPASEQQLTNGSAALSESPRSGQHPASWAGLNQLAQTAQQGGPKALPCPRGQVRFGGECVPIRDRPELLGGRLVLCPHPVNLKTTLASSGRQFGMDVSVQWDSSTGNAADLTGVFLTEHITYSSIPNPPFGMADGKPVPESGQTQRIPAGDGAPAEVNYGMDSHTWPRALVRSPPSEGSFTVFQTYDYRGGECGDVWNPFAYYTIEYSIYSPSKNAPLRFKTRKSGTDGPFESDEAI